MRVQPLTTVMSMPDAGMLLGTTAPQHILESINAQFNNGAVAFGGIGDMFADTYNQFNRAFVQASNTTLHMLEKAKVLISSRDRFSYVTREDDLLSIPPCMYAPLLTYEPIRDMHANERIDGWGIDPNTMPDVDPYENVLNRGFVETDEKGHFPETVYWTWSTDDPVLSMEDCEMIMDSRRFIENFLANELAEDGGMRDPTGFCDGLLIGEIE